MLPNTLAELLRLPTGERIELAMALWESLGDSERDAAFDLTEEQKAELDRRLADHIANPGFGSTLGRCPSEARRRRCETTCRSSSRS